MQPRVTPMLRVSDVQASIDWYCALGFCVVDTHRADGVVDWALLAFGDGRVMLNAGGARQEPRRDADLYVHGDGVDDLFARVGATLDVVEAPHDTLYGMRELIVRDPDGYWLTFAQPRTP